VGSGGHVRAALPEMRLGRQRAEILEGTGMASICSSGARASIIDPAAASSMYMG